MQRADYRTGRVLLSLLAVLVTVLMFSLAASQANATEAPVSGKGKVKVSLTQDSLSISKDSLSDATSTNKTVDPRYALSEGRTFEEYVGAVGYSVDSYWSQWFSYWELPYRSPSFYLLYDGVWCSNAYSSTYKPAYEGPFYCTGEQTIYYTPLFEFPNQTDGQYYRIDEYGDFAVAYVIAHEWAHHVQNWLGISLSAPYHELQADCLAGVWANSQYWAGYLDDTDIYEPLSIAWHMGGSSTHGTQNQRRHAFWYGYYYGRPASCDPSAEYNFVTNLEDDTNPVIGQLRPTGKTHDRTPTISAVVRDGGGELVKAHIKLYLDGKRVTKFFYAQETDKLRHATNRLAFGKHNVKVVATDAANNTATKRWSFTVVR